jgi:hypothetical protein
MDALLSRGTAQERLTMDIARQDKGPSLSRPVDSVGGPELR